MDPREARFTIYVARSDEFALLIDMPSQRVIASAPPVHDAQRSEYARAALQTAYADAMTRNAAVPATDALLGRYLVEHTLGVEAMGVVHAAVDLQLERRVALKVLRRAGQSPHTYEWLLREARAMARLAHANVVRVYEIAVADDRAFMAMELVEGQTLGEWLNAGPWPRAAILDAFVAAGRGLVAVHAAGIVHRDFKPSNVLRGHDGRIAITNFRLACPIDATGLAVLDRTIERKATFHTSSMPRKLTTAEGPAYMAPEQLCGGGITPATDQFAYCMALWEALGGRRPFCATSSDDFLAQIERGAPPAGGRRIPRRIRRALRRGLEFEPARRWPSMEELLERLAPALRRRHVVSEMLALR